MAASVVAHCHGVLAHVFQNVFEAHLFELRAGNGRIELADISAMVFGIMYFHGAGIDVGFQCIIGVRKVR